jgi:hypothetical protein
MYSRLLAIALLLPALAGFAYAAIPSDYLRSLETAARASDPAFRAFSASRGHDWFNARHGTDWSCSTCHT